MCLVEVILKKKVKGVRIIEAFPGFGLIGTIVTEYLLEHLEFEKVGVIEVTDVPAMIAVHQGEVLEPISLHYNKQYNLLVVHALNMAAGLEWKLGRAILDLAKQTSAKEIICLEGVGSPNSKSNVYYASRGISKNALKKLSGGAKVLQEGVIIGVTGALMALSSKTPLLALFAEAEGNKPDSNAAAKIILALDDYAGLDVDPNPLRKKARMFEEKLQDIAGKKQKAQKIHAKKSRLSYVG